VGIVEEVVVKDVEEQIGEEEVDMDLDMKDTEDLGMKGIIKGMGEVVTAVTMAAVIVEIII
jgi:hypothetical protein